jgi:hypothetical protein
MQIAVFEVLRPIHDRAQERLGRHYVLAVNELTLTVLRAGPYQGYSQHVDHFDNEAELREAVEEKLKRRIYHGYILVWWSDGFPWLDWLRDMACPVEWHELPPLGIQLELPWDR